MRSLSYKSRSVVLVFDLQVFYKRLSSVSPNKKTLLVTECDANQAKHSLDPSIDGQFGEFSKKSSINQISYKEVNTRLGLETDLIFFDAQNQFDVNVFTAICGTLVGGGELVMLLNDRLKSSLEYRELNSANPDISKTLLRFLEFLSKQGSTVTKSLPTNTIKYTLEDISNEDFEKASLEFVNSQTQLIEKIKRCAIGHAKRPIVLTANRGRGKSATLGMAAAELLNDTQIPIFITAPRKQQLSILFSHLHQRLEELTNPELARALVEKRVTFLPPDEAASLCKISGFLIIEEAGAIPTQILTRYLENSNRMIFSTTIDGYEGNGQGFEIRFKAILKNKFPQFKTLTITQPARWPNYDLLEEAINAAFLLSQSKQIEQIIDKELVIRPEFELVEKSELNRNESLLRSIYQLLVNAHYQTRPSDLEKILSQESVNVFIIKVGDSVVAASLVCREGPLSKAEFEQIEDKNTRLPGHLLPQSLIAHQGISKAASLTFLRIMRIAVHPNYRRKGLASQLIGFIEGHACENNVDLIGTSFSLFTDVVKFWYANGFAAIRIGIRKDSSTGSHTGEFLKVINQHNKSSIIVHNSSINKFNQSFSYLVSCSLKHVASDVLLCISLMQPALNVTNQAVQEKLFRNEIEQYLSQKRSLEMVEWQLYIMTKSILFGAYEGKPENVMEDRLLENYELIFAKIIQRKSWQEIVTQFKFTGIRQSREKIRLVLETLYD